MSGAMSRRKGSTAERAVVNYLRGHGFPNAERRGTGLPGADVADLGPGLELEIKNHARLELAAWVDQLVDAMDDTDADMGAVIVKRRGTTDVGQWYFVQPQNLWLDLRPGPSYVACQRHRIDYGSIAPDLDFAIAQAEQEGGLFPCVQAPRRGSPYYVITTVAHGVRLLRQAGYGDPIEPTKETTRS